VAGEAMYMQQLQIRFPVYMIGTRDREHGRLASTIDGQDWLLLYPSLEIAELYIELSDDESLAPAPASGAELSEILASLPNVAGFLWNCLTPRRFQFLMREDFES
jgi:hypothetical protein